MYAITTVAYYRLPLKAIITYRPTKDDVSSGIILFDHVLIWHTYKFYQFLDTFFTSHLRIFMCLTNFYLNEYMIYMLSNVSYGMYMFTLLDLIKGNNWFGIVLKTSTN